VVEGDALTRLAGAPHDDDGGSSSCVHAFWSCLEGAHDGMWIGVAGACREIFAHISLDLLKLLHSAPGLPRLSYPQSCPDPGGGSAMFISPALEPHERGEVDGVSNAMTPSEP
jgi:hypothetical protein